MEQSEKSLLEQIEDLKKALEASEGKYSRGPNIKVEDHMELAGKYLNDAAKTALAVKGKNLVEVYNRQIIKSTDGKNDGEWVREAAVCQFFTCTVRKDRVEEGIKAISESINKLADMGAIHSCLAPVSSVDLAMLMFKHQTTAVICYVHIRPGFEQAAKNVRFNTREGEVGEALHSLDIELPPGEFFAECRLLHQMAMLHPVKSNEGRIFDVVKDYMKFLPEGTEFIGYRPVAIMDLSMPYELKFKNPILQKVKRVELDCVREAVLLDDSQGQRLHQFNLVTGIRYLGVRPDSQDGKIENLY